MNTPTTAESDEVTRLEKLRAQLSGDIEVMQQKEASLREYEQKLRALVEHANVGGQNGNPHSPAAGTSQSAMDAEWEKYQRANALLEAARRSLTDDRLALKDREEKVMIREQEVARREAWLKAREQQQAARIVAEAATLAAKPKPSFTAAPFIAARNLLSMGKTS